MESESGQPEKVSALWEMVDSKTEGEAVNEKNIREIARGHGWPEDDFLKEVDRLRKGYAYTEEGALAQAQKHYARKFGVDSKESRLRKIAQNQGFDEGVFLKEYGRLIAEGRSDMDALSQTMGLFEKGAKAERGPTLADFGPRRMEEIEIEEVARLGAPPGEKPTPPEPRPPKVEAKPKTKPEAKTVPKVTAYNKLIELVGNHLIEIYSDTGNGKSRLAHHIAAEAERNGKKVLYLDTEKSLPVGYEKQLKNYEVHTAKTALELMKQLINRVRRARDEDFNLIVVDSIGLPVLAALPEMKMRERGDAFQLMALLRFQMMGFAFERGLAIAMNQPVSELSRVSIGGKEPRVLEGEQLPPFGGKSEFMAKLILRSEAVQKSPNQSIFKLMVYKARDRGQDYEFARFTISDKGVEIQWKR